MARSQPGDRGENHGLGKIRINNTQLRGFILDPTQSQTIIGDEPTALIQPRGLRFSAAHLQDSNEDETSVRISPSEDRQTNKGIKYLILEDPVGFLGRKAEAFEKKDRRVTIQAGEQSEEILLFDKAINNIILRTQDIESFEKSLVDYSTAWRGGIQSIMDLLEKLRRKNNIQSKEAIKAKTELLTKDNEIISLRNEITGYQRENNRLRESRNYYKDSIIISAKVSQRTSTENDQLRATNKELLRLNKELNTNVKKSRLGSKRPPGSLPDNLSNDESDSSRLPLYYLHREHRQTKTLETADFSTKSITPGYNKRYPNILKFHRTHNAPKWDIWY